MAIQTTSLGGEYVDESDIVTTVGDPGSDAKVPSEQAVREALNVVEPSGSRTFYLSNA